MGAGVCGWGAAAAAAAGGGSSSGDPKTWPIQGGLTVQHAYLGIGRRPVTTHVRASFWGLGAGAPGRPAAQQAAIARGSIWGLERQPLPRHSKRRLRCSCVESCHPDERVK